MKPKGCPEAAKRKAPGPSCWARGLQATNISYSHSFTLVCRGDNPVDSSLVVGFRRFVAESRRMSSCGHLGQILGQNRGLFRNREPAVPFLSPGTKTDRFWSSEPSEMVAKMVDYLLSTYFAKLIVAIYQVLLNISHIGAALNQFLIAHRR